MTGGNDPEVSTPVAAVDLSTLHRTNLFRGLVDRAAAAEMSQERMRALLDAVLSVASDLSLPDVLRRMVGAARELADAGRGRLVPHGEGEVVEVTAPDLPAAVRAALDGRAAPGAALEVPIRVRGEDFGTLHLEGELTGAGFTREDSDVVVALAAAAGMAIENARHYDLTSRYQRWLRATNQVTAVLRAGAGDDGGFDLLARRAREVSEAAVAIVAVRDDDSGELLVRTVSGPLAADMTGLRVPVGASLTGDAFATARGRVLDDVGEAARLRSTSTYESLPAGARTLGPAVLAPLNIGHRPNGVLIVARERGGRRFDQADLRMVGEYAANAALAIEFAAAQQDRQRLVLLEERDRIARDLHDLVIQRLFALGLGLQGLKRDPAAPTAPERLGGFVAEIDQTIRELRRSIFSLQQPANNAHSVRGEILRAVSDATAPLGYEPAVRLEGPLDSVVPADIALDLIATLRESLSNVVRHARAAAVQVTVSVDRTATLLGLVVQDDGRGLPTGTTHRSGLANMAQRARRWSGQCRITTGPGGGTVVDWEVPLRTAARAASGPTTTDQEAGG